MLRPVLANVLFASCGLRSASAAPLSRHAARNRTALPVTALTLALGFALSCGADSSPASRENTEPSAGAPVTAKSDAKSNPNLQTVSARGSERPLPAFEGRTLTGDRISISSLIGKRLVLFFFNPEVESAAVVSRAIASVAAQRAEFNFNILGIAIGSNPVTASEFVSKMGFDFPVIDDSRGRITAKLGLRAPVVLLSVDPEGFLGELAMGSFATEAENAWTTIADQIRQKLRIPSPDDSSSTGALDQRPLAPAFDTPLLAGGGNFSLSSRKGKPLVLIFFLHSCPHCHSALNFLQAELSKMEKEKRPEVIAVSISSRAGNSVVRASLRSEGIDVDELILLSDPTEEVAGQYGVFGGVPVIYLIDDTGRIVRRIQGWEGGREQALLRMQLAQVAGSRVPMLLNPKGYTGSEVCGICHVDEYNSWRFTQHASAYDTLVTHGQERDAECVSCHVAGFGEPGGFTLEEKPHHLENVSCENCHGRGGPHLSPGFVTAHDYQSACLSCHNKEHSLGFEYASFLPRISHQAIAGLSTAERAEMLALRGKPRDVLPQSADHVGSNACRSCHSAEFDTWSQSGHGHAGETLTRASKAGDAACLACHTTGFGRPGGFPAEAALADHADLARVGCESCHGPGGDHVEPGAQRIGSIVSLGDKCDSCVILQICGRCHDDANDPGFEFEVVERIERQRHGTIEAGTGKPIGTATDEPLGDGRSAGAHHPPGFDRPTGSELAQVFSLLDSAQAERAR